jgi:hypothetical protein
MKFVNAWLKLLLCVSFSYLFVFCEEKSTTDGGGLPPETNSEEPLPTGKGSIAPVGGVAVNPSQGTGPNIPKYPEYIPPDSLPAASGGVVVSSGSLSPGFSEPTCPQMKTASSDPLGVEVRSAPNAMAPSISYIEPGKLVNVTGVNEGWLEVSLPVGKGFVYNQFLVCLGSAESEISNPRSEIGVGQYDCSKE